MQSNKRYIPRNINGILLLDKSKGLSSNHALQRVKHLFQAKKAGHTGSLDPLATGMLPICLGEATKFSHFLLDADKTYQTTAKLGIATSTADAEGDIIATATVPNLSIEMIEKVLAKFLGPITQIPPIYSALKHQGQPLYKLARKGIAVEPKQRSVTIYRIKLLGFTEDSLSLEVQCSKGTYIRTLVEDIGKALNTVAHVQELRRIAVTPFENQPYYCVDSIKELSITELDNLLLPVDAALQSLPKIMLSEADAKKLQQGQSIELSDPIITSTQLYRLYYSENLLLGVGQLKNDFQLVPQRLVATKP